MTPERLFARAMTRLRFSEYAFPHRFFVGRCKARHAREVLRPHRHYHGIEITYLVRGVQIYEVNQQPYVLRGNDVFVTFPGELHSSAGNPQDKCLHYWMGIDIRNTDAGFLNFPAADSRPLFDALLHLPVRHFRGDESLRTLFDQILLTHFFGTPELRRARVATLAFELLYQINACAQLAKPEALSNDINTVLSYIEANIDQRIALDEMADTLNLSRSRFNVKFKNEVGVPPAEYILRRKIERAKHFLTTQEMTVTDIAFALGFSSSPYFSTVFKRFTGQRPLEYAEACQRCDHQSLADTPYDV